MLIHGDAVTLLETPGGNATAGLATPSRGAQEVSVIRQRQLPGGYNPPHSHDREEVMVVREGTVSVTIDTKSALLGPGDILIIPAHTAHQIENSGTTEAEWLLIAPAGVRFFHATGEEAHPAWAR